jgi:site-specific recombinase XerD
MKPAAPSLSALIERFFIERLMQQKQVSPHTIASYRDTFRLLFKFAEINLHTAPSKLVLRQLDVPLIAAFLNDLERRRSVSARTRNLRLTAIRSFFRFLSFEQPAYSGHIQRVLAIPAKRHRRKLVTFLNRREVEALLAAPDRGTWVGRRDHTLMLLAVQTGLRLSEIIGLDREALSLGRGAYVRCVGKGRKERCTPLTRELVAALRRWLREPVPHGVKTLFPTIHGHRLSADAVQYLVKKHAATAQMSCPSMKQKCVSPHLLRHTAAMELLGAGVDSSVIALWLGHESVDTTQVYLEAHLALKEAALAKVGPLKHKRLVKYQPPDRLLAFLNAL